MINWNAKCFSVSRAPFREKNPNRFQKLYLIVKPTGVPLVLFLSHCEFLNGTLPFATLTRDVSCTTRSKLQLLFLEFNKWPEEPFDAKKPISRSLVKIGFEILLSFAGKMTEVVLRDFAWVIKCKCIDHQPSSPKIISPKPPVSSPARVPVVYRLNL